MVDPISLFDDWFVSARASEPSDSNAMALATTGTNGQPTVRMVLLKDHGPDGFLFYTNQHSSKAEQISERSFAALLFHWKSLRRQVRIEGKVLRADEKSADEYFATRSRDSQLGAWASDQSQHLDARATLEARFADMKARFENQPIPRPPFWKGYCVWPERIEFWQDRAHRLHERRLFTRNGNSWSESLLYP